MQITKHKSSIVISRSSEILLTYTSSNLNITYYDNHENIIHENCLVISIYHNIMTNNRT